MDWGAINWEKFAVHQKHKFIKSDMEKAHNAECKDSSKVAELHTNFALCFLAYPMTQSPLRGDVFLIELIKQ